MIIYRINDTICSRMITSEKVKLVDSVEFLQQEIQKADANLLEKEKELQSIKSEKEVQVRPLKSLPTIWDNSCLKNACQPYLCYACFTKIKIKLMN